MADQTPLFPSLESHNNNNNNITPDPFAETPSGHADLVPDANAILGRRMDPPRFALHMPSSSNPLNMETPPSAFATPLGGPMIGGITESVEAEDSMRRFNKDVPVRSINGEDGGPVCTPTHNSEPHAKDVDEALILNLNQEGDLEKLTRNAVKMSKDAWKPIIMEELKTQLKSLDDDQWIFD